MPEDDTPADTENALSNDRFANVPVEISILVGTARPLIRDLLALEEDVVLPLDRSIEEPVDLVIGDRLIARGELEEIGGEGSGRLGVRVTEVILQEKPKS
jgi:flagellar motor switch protein FliN/FliY